MAHLTLQWSELEIVPLMELMMDQSLKPKSKLLFGF
jgi:hypothetical protein